MTNSKRIYEIGRSARIYRSVGQSIILKYELDWYFEKDWGFWLKCDGKWRWLAKIWCFFATPIRWTICCDLKMCQGQIRRQKTSCIDLPLLLLLLSIWWAKLKLIVELSSAFWGSPLYATCMCIWLASACCWRYNMLEGCVYVLQ